MTSLRLITILLALMLVTTTVQASNLRYAADTVRQGPSASGSSDHSSDNITQDSSASIFSDAQSGTSGAEQNSNIIETQSRVEDPTAPTVGETGGVKAWAQCGGLYYLGETKCQQHTFCKQLSEFISVCFPESRPTEKVIRLEL